MPSSRFQVIQTVDLRTKTKSFKIYERVMAPNKATIRQPVVIGIATREEAEVKLRELEQEAK